MVWSWQKSTSPTWIANSWPSTMTGGSSPSITNAPVTNAPSTDTLKPTTKAPTIAPGNPTNPSSFDNAANRKVVYIDYRDIDWV